MRVTVTRLCMTAIAAVMISAIAEAHVVISPSQSTQGATEKFTVRVPTEGTVATVGAEIDIPDGVVVETISVANGGKYELKRDADKRITGIVWTMTIPPGEFAEFAFVARVPRDKTELVWGLRQRLADGKIDDFTKAPNGSIRPTAVTKLAPRAGQ
jgi:uncharacterized protein YcnI